MEHIRIQVEGNTARVVDRPGRITSGTVGLPVEFSFDSQWDGLNKTAVFRAGRVCKITDSLGEEATVPWEVLVRPNVWLSIGVYGANEDGSVVIPTICTNVCVIQAGVMPEGDPGISPTLPVWQKLINAVGSLFGLKTKAKGSLVDAINEVHSIARGGGVIPDATLSESGIPADAKATGDAISGIFGEGNAVGQLGYYYSRIDFAENKITLSTSQTEEVFEGEPLWAIGDKVSIDNGGIHPECATITAINGNVITVDKLPFAEIKQPAEMDFEDFAIYVSAKPNAGVVDFGKYAFAAGEGNRATGRSSMALGRENTVTGKYGVALGRDNVVKAYGAVVTGNNNKALPNAQGAFISGEKNEVFGYNGVANGYGNTVTGDYAAAFGKGTNADGEYSTTFGYDTSTTTEGVAATAMGNSTIASGENSVAMGNKTRATKKNAFAIGENCKADAEHSFSGGNTSFAGGWGSIAFGSSTKTGEDGTCAVAFGVNAQSLGQGSFAVGRDVTAREHAQAVVGAFNADDPNARFIVGNGADKSPSNAMVVRKDGNVDMYNHKIIRVANGTNPTDAVNKSQLDTRVRTTLAVHEGTDLNTITNCGFYWLNGDEFPHSPKAGKFEWSPMLVLGGSGFSTVTQIIARYTTGELSIRSGSIDTQSAAWIGNHEWKQPHSWENIVGKPSGYLNRSYDSGAINSAIHTFNVSGSDAKFYIVTVDAGELHSIVLDLNVIAQNTTKTYAIGRNDDAYLSVKREWSTITLSTSLNIPIVRVSEFK